MADKEAKVVFKAETADLQAEVKAANSEISGLRAEMKLNEAQFQNTGDESAYYQTKLDLLAQQLDANREKQEALRAEIETAKQVFGENSAEVGKLETSLTYAQVQEENLKKQVGETNAEMDGTAASVESAGASFEDFAGVIAAAGIADAVSEIAQAAYDVAAEFDEASAAIVEGTGASGEALESLNDSATAAFGAIADSDTSIGDVSSALAEINTRFGLTGDAAETLTEQVTNFANHTGGDAAASVDSLADVLNRWGMSSGDAAGLLDDLTTANQACQASADELMGYLSKNSTQFQELGYSTEDALALLVSLEDGGANTSTVMSGLTKAVSNLSEATDDVPGGFETAIDAIGQCDSVAEALQATVGDTGLTVEDVFGTKAAQELATNIQNGSFAIDDWKAALESNDGALEQTTEDATTMADEWAQASNAIMAAVDSVFSPAVEQAVAAVASVVSEIAGFVSGSETAQTVVRALAVAMGVFAAAMAISSLIQGVTKAMQALNLAMNANPVMLVVTAVAALVAALVTAYATNEKFRNAVNSAFSAIVTTVTGAVSKVVEAFKTVKSAITNVFKNAGTWLVDVGENIVTGLVSGITSFTSKVKDAITALAGQLPKWAKSILGISSPSKVFAEIGSYTVMGLAQGIEGGTAGAVSAMSGLIGSVQGAATGWQVPAQGLSAMTAAGQGAAGSLSVNVTVSGDVNVDSEARMDAWAGRIASEVRRIETMRGA